MSKTKAGTTEVFGRWVHSIRSQLFFYVRQKDKHNKIEFCTARRQNSVVKLQPIDWQLHIAYFMDILVRE